MKVTDFIWWLSWSNLLIASPLEERAVSSSMCNNAQVKALRSSNAGCYCSSYLQIPVLTVTKLTTFTSTIRTTVTQKQIMNKISTNNVKSTITTRTITASPQTGYTTLTKTVTVTPQARSLHRRKHLGHPGELVERAAVSTCVTPAVVKSMNKVAISSACKCLSIAPRQTTITKTTTKRVTQVSTKIVSSTALRTTTIKSSLIAVATFTPPLKLVTRTVMVTVTAKTSTSIGPKSTSISSVRDNGVSRSSSKTSSRPMSSLSTISPSSQLATNSRTSSSKPSSSVSSSKLASISLTISPSSSTVTSFRSVSKSTSSSSDKPASFPSSSQFLSSKSSSTTSEFPASTAGDDQVPSKTTASSTDRLSSRLLGISTSKTSSLSTSKSSSRLSITSSSKTSITSASSSSKKLSSSSKPTTTSETASTRPYPPEGPLYTPNTNACASRTAKSLSSTSTRSRTSSTLSSSRSTMTSTFVSLSSWSIASSSTRSSSTPRFSFPSNSTMSASATTNPSSTSSSSLAVNKLSYDDSSITDTNDTSSTDTTTSTNIPTSLLNFTPNQPFYLQSFCTSNLQISGLYATLIPTTSNPTLQFTSSASLATLFYLSTSGYLYILPSFSSAYQSYSDQTLLANIDVSATEMDFFFDEQEEIDAVGAQLARCGVDEDGVLQCKTGQTTEVLYCEDEGTVKLAGCVLEGCDAAELAVVYV